MTLKQTTQAEDYAEKLIGEILLSRNQVQAVDVEKALQLQASVGGRIGSNLIRIGALSEDTLLSALSIQLSLPIFDTDDLPDALEIYRFMVSCEENFEWFISREVVIWPGEEGKLNCAARDILDPSVNETLRMFHPECELCFVLTTSQTLEQLLRVLKKEQSVEF